MVGWTNNLKKLICIIDQSRLYATFLTHLREFKKRPFQKKKQGGEGGGARGVEDIPCIMEFPGVAIKEIACGIFRG